MIELIKQKFFEYLRELGYTVIDTWVLRNSFPYLNLRVSNGTFSPMRDGKQSTVGLCIDIFSTYKGEKEILEIVENINSNLLTFIDANSEVIYGEQTALHILDDDKTGPVRKHGVVNYTFTLAKGDDLGG